MLKNSDCGVCVCVCVCAREISLSLADIAPYKTLIQTAHEQLSSFLWMLIGNCVRIFDAHKAPEPHRGHLRTHALSETVTSTASVWTYHTHSLLHWNTECESAPMVIMDK